MAIKFECLKEYLLRVTSESPVEIKEKLVEFHFGNKDDIIANLTLNELKSFYKLFYDGDAPIPNLRKHFSDYESKLKQGETLTATANPISAFFTDNSENGEELKQLDKANADMVIYTSRPGNLPLRLPGNAEPDAV
uniref:Uncharacterized protein n=1 Tax=Babesia bigemina TaxID=5866 RepID=Q9GSQ7_BABBI|nr:unknown [Babesia bigemina]